MEYRAGDAKIDANYPIARKLVETFPEKAIELIVSTCEYHEISKSLAVAGHARSLNAPIVNARNQYSALEAPFRPSSSSSASSHHSGAPKPSPVTSRYPRSRANTTSAVLPPSPAPTSSTGQSSNRPEYINVPIGGNKECQLSMRNSPLQHSVIRESVVDRQLKGYYEVEENPNGPFCSPIPGAQNAVLNSFIDLTWRRAHSYKTHMARVYLVQEDIDFDILLGEADSGEALTATMGAQSRGQHGTTIAGQPEISSPHPQRPFNSHMRPPAPDPPFPAASFHRSSIIEESPNHTPMSAIYQGLNHVQSFTTPNVHLSHQDPQDLPFHARSRPLSGDMSHMRGPPTSDHDPPLSQVHEQGSDPEELRVECTWDKICSTVKLDLNAPAENFLPTIDKKFKRYKKVLGRDDTHSLRFTAEKGAEGGYALSLEESDLVDDWVSAMDWVRDNKRTKAPHIFVVVECDEFDGG
ncbi:hypothetical protein FKW77_006922 [Venturia effusa]|uniref:Uncharacterized protein n=1 Tax=Venturia effusa TaxID=50376 RepID=A0A517KWP2_9PEZI|nr:hypothetical protein FKW77_006922 [Venturia effusa]